MASYEKIRNYIEHAMFYDKEYDVIDSLIRYSDPRFFTKILEEVVDGNMYWVDFYPILDTPSYKKMLQEGLSTQEELYNELVKMSDFRKNVEALYEKNNLGIHYSHEKYDELSKEYDDEKIFNILQYNSNDNAMTIACKAAMYNAIENYKLLKDPKNTEYKVNAFGELQIWDSTNNTVEFFDYINPDDIIYSADDIIIPIDSRYQTLDDSDISFMMENNLNEAQMKQFKALRTFISINGGGI